MVNNAKVTKETSLNDVAQISNTLTTVTSAPKENTGKMVVSRSV